MTKKFDERYASEATVACATGVSVSAVDSMMEMAREENGRYIIDKPASMAHTLDVFAGEGASRLEAAYVALDRGYAPLDWSEDER